jgi:hypothetical protein
VHYCEIDLTIEVIGGYCCSIFSMEIGNIHSVNSMKKIKSYSRQREQCIVKTCGRRRKVLLAAGEMVSGGWVTQELQG